MKKTESDILFLLVVELSSLMNNGDKAIDIGIWSQCQCPFKTDDDL